MPCDTVRTISVEFKPRNFNILEKTAKAMGFTVFLMSGHAVVRTPQGDIRIENGQATGPKIAVELHLNNLRVEYAKQAIKQVATKMGWQTQWQGTNQVNIRKG